jgi:hypothetical protein
MAQDRADVGVTDRGQAHSRRGGPAVFLLVRRQGLEPRTRGLTRILAQPFETPVMGSSGSAGLRYDLLDFRTRCRRQDLGRSRKRCTKRLDRLSTVTDERLSPCTMG